MTQPRLLGGRYELDGVVGRGGMAEVYRARDIRLDRIVAIKTLRADLARDQIFQARFRREAQSAASLNHPSIVAVYDTGEDMATRPPRAVHRHGVRGRPHGAGPAAGRPPAAARAVAGDHRRGAARPGLQPSGRHRAPRHQAGQRDGDPQRRHQGHGLRHRPGDERRPGHDDPDGPGDRHRAVPVAGAGPRRAGRFPQRPVLDRLPAVRAADRPAPVHRRFAGRDRLPARAGEPGAAVPGGPRRAPVGGRDRAQGDGQVPGRPVPDRRRHACRPATRRFRHAGGGGAADQVRHVPADPADGRRHDDGGATSQIPPVEDYDYAGRGYDQGGAAAGAARAAAGSRGFSAWCW